MSAVNGTDSPTELRGKLSIALYRSGPPRSSGSRIDHTVRWRAQKRRSASICWREPSKIDLNVETVFAAAKAEILGGRNLDLVYARANLIVAHIADDVIAFADENIGFAFAPAVEIECAPSRRECAGLR